MKPKRVRVFAPATIANLGPGFDCLGVALARPGDFAVAERRREPGVEFRVIGRLDGMPRRGSDNVACHVARLMVTELRPRFGIALTLDKRMPIGSGLGSSAASGVAAAVAVNALLDRPLPRRELLRFAVEGERKASGAAHADNVAPALLGGVCLVRGNPATVVQLPAPAGIVWVVVHPHVVLATAAARRALPRRVPLADAARQWANVAGLVAGLATGDAALAGACIEDVIVEPARARLIPGFGAVKSAALEAGALGCSIAGAGPSVFAIARSEAAASRIGRAMRLAFRRQARRASDVHVSRTDPRGARVIRRGA